MPAFSRAVLPVSSSPPRSPQALLSGGGLGKMQARPTLQVGRTWSEVFDMLKSTDTTVRGWLAHVQQTLRNGTTMDVDHRSYLTANGPGGGTPLINGASQTGSSIAVDGCTASTLFLRAGDLVLLGALTQVFELVADATANGSGQVNLTLDMGVVSGGSPADNAAVTSGANVKFKAKLVDFDEGRTGNDMYIRNMRLTWLETT